MAWSPVLPTVPGLYWAETNTGYVVVVKVDQQSVQKFALTKMEPSYFRQYGDPVSVPDFWSPSVPADEGWFGIKRADNSETIVRVAAGEKIHCYDFDHSEEVPAGEFVQWAGPLDIPKAPKIDTPAQTPV